MAEAGGVRQTKSAQMERETNRLFCWKESGRVRSLTTARGVHVCVCVCGGVSSLGPCVKVS